MTDIAAFLKDNVEGYLFGDLRKMKVTSPEEVGVGYPLLMTTFAGIEILGALLSKKPLITKKAHAKQKTHARANDGWVYFGAYWKDHLYPTPSPRAAFGAPLYQLVRHGIAHTFTMKGNLGVLQGCPELHLALDANGRFVIDAALLADDLVASYARDVSPMLDKPMSDPKRSMMQLRLDEMTQLDSEVVASYWKELGKATVVHSHITVVTTTPPI